MSNGKITYESQGDSNIQLHRLYGQAPELNRAYGLWIIGASIGCVSSPDGYSRCPRRRFEFYSLSHMYAGRGMFWQPGGAERELRPGEAVVIAPGDLNRYGGNGECYHEDSIRFVGRVADLMHQHGLIRTGVYRMGPLRRIRQTAEMIADPSPAAQVRANILLQQLLAELHFEQEKHAVSPVAEAISLVKAAPEKWWTVSELAELCNLSGNQFRRNFEHHTGMSPKRYLEELKLRRAAELLVSTLEPAAEIARLCGYVDPYHFNRRFKRFFGIAPGLYRRNAALAFPKMPESRRK